jgi:hypothetical protein
VHTSTRRSEKVVSTSASLPSTLISMGVSKAVVTASSFATGASSTATGIGKWVV